MALTKVDISLMDNATGFTIVTKVVTVAASKLVIDGVSQDTLTLTEGYTYKFDTSHATLSGHTVSFATAVDAAGSTQYTTGVTTNGTPGNAGAYTQIVVAQSAPVLYYYCANHASMGGTTSTPAAVIANKLLAYDGSGNLPAVDGSQLTNVSTATSSASDPTVSTNPSGGVGTEWQNTTSGEVYICTDATAGANVWTNVGAGTGNIVPWVYPGSAYGYVAGGYGDTGGSAPQTVWNVIDKVSFTSDGNATDVGDLPTPRAMGGGHTSATHGYSSAGQNASWANIDNIDKYSFASDGNAVDTGADLLFKVAELGSASSNTHGYFAGGNAAPPAYESTQFQNAISKFSFSASTNGTDVGNLTAHRWYAGCTNSESYGYCAGGQNPNTIPSPYVFNIIDKWSFVSDGNATDVGDLVFTARVEMGNSSTTYGYSTSINTSGSRNSINKYSFSSDGNATDVGDLSVTRDAAAGTSSTTYGYGHGGGPVSGTASNVIDKFSFSSDGNATDVGNMTTNRGYIGGGAQT